LKVLVIGTLYEPDLGPSAPLFTLLSENLVERGHSVTVITMVPHYPSGRVSPPFKGKYMVRSLEKGVDVIRVGLPSVNRSKLGQRFLQFACYQIGAAFASLIQECDVVLAANPSLTVWLPFAWMVGVRRKPAVFSIQDLYPDVGISLGIFGNRLATSAVGALERFCLNRSSIVQIISDSFRPGLRALGVADSKMILAYNWVDTQMIRPLSRGNTFSQQYNLTGRFVVLYAGNLGIRQGLEHVLTAAKQLADQQDLLFVFVGDGSGRKNLMARAKQQQLTNVQFLPFQVRERIPEVLGCADVSLISLQRGIGAASVPSKIFPIMASGRPIIASVDQGCETWNLVEKAEAGLCIPPENPLALAEAILSLKRDQGLCERLGRNGRAWAERYHSAEHAAEEFERLLFTAICIDKALKLGLR
jgi:colanic acid biosynthesis glycosyl transferase WcaI